MKHLGKNSSSTYTFKQNFKYLEQIPRSICSDEIIGCDYWNAYEFSFLINKKQQLKILEINIPFSSKFTVESKSLKLYLNNFYNIDKNEKEIINIIKNDLSKLTESNVNVSFIQKFPKPPKSTSLNSYKNKYLKPNSLYLYEGFRSICPVTSQPDWAHIYIKSDKKIENIWIYKLLYSYRNKGDFHEDCITGIYNKIKNKYKPNELVIYGRFLRRGGIDINPIRSSNKKILFKNFRSYMQ